MLKRFIAAFYLGAVIGFSGCSYNPINDEDIRKIVYERKRNSYALEDLCDTEISERDLTIHVYIEPYEKNASSDDINNSDKIWDYRRYKDELFGYVKEFFKKQKINCNFVYSKHKFYCFNKSDEVGVEILDCNSAFADRFFELVPPNSRIDRIEKRGDLINKYNLIATNKGVALINGSAEEFRIFLSQKEMEEEYSKPYRGMTKKDYILKTNANNICHEILHLLGLFHPRTFFPNVIDDFINGIPNTMSYYPPDFSKDHVVGSDITELQRKLIHSYIAGGNVYKAFHRLERNRNLFHKKIAWDNYRIVRD